MTSVTDRLTPAKTGALDVLNTGAGHLTFKFDKDNPENVEKAKKVITDMLKRGYMIFVKVNGEQVRVRQFDAATDEYILEEPDTPVNPEPQQLNEAAAQPPKRGRGRPRKNETRVPMKQAQATAIGPTAGG